MDDPAISLNILSIIRGINRLSVNRDVGTHVVPWPASNTLYRGGSLPNHHKPFFTTGKMYRVPMYLATSADQNISQQGFCYQAEVDGLPPVLYNIYIHPQLKCKHVNFVNRRHGHEEWEYLFVPYSVFIVAGVVWMQNPTHTHPHYIYLYAMTDNKEHPEDLPLASWH